MKRIIPFLLCCIIFTLIPYETYCSSVKSKDLCEAVICRRIQILNDYYKGRITSIFAEEQLKNTESEEMLAKDILLMKKFKQTDIDTIDSFTVKSNRIIQRKNNIIKGTIKIKYKMISCTQIYIKTVKYKYRCIISKNNNSKKIKILNFAV